MAALAASVLVAGGYLAGLSRGLPEVSVIGSVDAGFARDMVLHHGQAVTLAMNIIPRTTMPVVRDMAHDIAVTQQREAGEMTGWLEQWGLPTSTTAAPMTWMTHGPATPPGGHADRPATGDRPADRPAGASSMTLGRGRNARS